MKRTIATSAAAIALLAATACSNGDSSDVAPTMTDREYTYAVAYEVYGKSMAAADAAADQPETVEATVAVAAADCGVVQGFAKSTSGPSVTSSGAAVTAADTLDPLVAKQAQESGRTEQQVRARYLLSARFKCPEYTAMLEAYDRVSQALGK
ncbi:exported hypothetical protein [Rhodococcus sp. RD6.2]|uniref:hypothetical protein n=1 Tax=Rhodococcus sp. RD6.2 TaxID=260936 RepID=UPI00063BAF3D|nr:hypothetical protein [Rhodococcus sp. RD6.2]CRK49538.1 exported hypothetical protein [Rhodococcus sp. RD6.2]